MKNSLEVTDVSLAYGKRTILEHISFTLAAGEAVALCGENGSGKTTLLSAAAGILRPAHGRIKRNGKVGYVPQSAALLEDMTFADNLRYFSSIARVRVPQVLPLEADELRPIRVRDMSGGMKKLCNLVCTLVAAPDILLRSEERRVGKECRSPPRRAVCRTGRGACRHACSIPRRLYGGRRQPADCRA